MKRCYQPGKNAPEFYKSTHACLKFVSLRFSLRPQILVSTQPWFLWRLYSLLHSLLLKIMPVPCKKEPGKACGKEKLQIPYQLTEIYLENKDKKKKQSLKNKL